MRGQAGDGFVRIEFQDGYGQFVSIDSMDPETLGRWLIETLDRFRPDYVAPARVQCYPSFGRDGKPDWITDTRVLGQPGIVSSPQALIDYLRGQLERAEKTERTVSVTADVRRWAQRHDIPVPDSGPVPAEVRERWERRHDDDGTADSFPHSPPDDGESSSGGILDVDDDGQFVVTLPSAGIERAAGAWRESRGPESPAEPRAASGRAVTWPAC